MKKIVFFIIVIFVFCIQVNADTLNLKEQVSFVSCNSATTYWFKTASGEKKRIRLLAFDSEDGSLNQEIESYVCNILATSSNIEIEYDPKVTAKDQYNRELVWVYIDGELLQKKLISLGYGQVNYVKDEYLYLDDLCETQKNAFASNLGIWNYPNIKEDYCFSGEKNSNNTLDEKQNQHKQNKINQNALWYLIFLNSGILLCYYQLLK